MGRADRPPADRRARPARPLDRVMMAAAAGPTWAAIVTALSAVVGLVGGALTLWRILAEIRATHHAVNSTAQKQTGRIEQLTATLTEQGVDVPPRKEEDLPEPPPPPEAP